MQAAEMLTDGVSVEEVARRLRVSVRQLEDNGLVERRPSPSDRRATLVELSEKGRALMPELQEAWRRVAEQSVAGFTAIPLDQLAEVLANLAASLDGSHDRSGPAPFNEAVPGLPRDA